MYKKILLDNGIRVVTENIPHVRSVSIGIWVNVGSRDETGDLNGISHFIEHMLFKGTKKRSAKDIAIEMDQIGGEMNAFTSKEWTAFYAKVLDEHLPVAADILSDIFLNSVFDEKEIERERGVIIEEIKMVEDTPDDLIHELLYETVWRGNPLGQPILGTKKNIRRFNRDQLIGHMKKFYRPGETVISVAGNFRHGSLMELLNKTFGAKKTRGKKPETPAAAYRHGVVVKPRKLEQAYICMGARGYPFSHKDRFGIYSLNTLLGSSMSSRLYQEIRERRGLAYSVFSYLTSLKDTGLFAIYAAVSPSKAASVVRLISKEIKKVRKDGITADELTKVKEQLKGNMVLSMESTNNRMSMLAKQEIYLGRHYTLDEMLAQIDAVSLEQVERITADAFSGGETTLTALGPVRKEDLAPALKI